jgi:glutathione synthase/RimK-type ligase-like ATP-grasp enzyme
VSLVAVATCASEQLVDPDSPLLLAALDAQGVAAELCVWDDARVRWDRFDLVVVRSTWDYTNRRAAFLEWANALHRVLNPVGVLAYSSDKHYLVDLAQRGHAVVATAFCDVGERPTFPDRDFVVKPCVGAGSIDAERFRPRDIDIALEHVARLHAAGRDAMIQPYVESVDTLGERALVFINATFSHAMTKGAMLNVASSDRDALFRREQMSRAIPEPEALAAAQAILDDHRFADLLYARVDLVNDDGKWRLMELELVEPSLFLGFDDNAAAALARAVRARLDDARSS